MGFLTDGWFMRLVDAGCGVGLGGGGLGGIEEAIEGGAADAEHFGGADFVAVDAGKNAGDVAKDGAVEVGFFRCWIVRRRCGGVDRPL